MSFHWPRLRSWRLGAPLVEIGLLHAGPIYAVAGESMLVAEARFGAVKILVLGPVMQCQSRLQVLEGK